ncbi:hypothetical protein QJS04_geneDACA015172 [Acorus gramineus]|uniref:Uncharacterized protein n=1 Tax=Acorus gramineus TaxID=55184 RepID=A0AAV9BX82_ACOGR|nr:hypothetical protein QJS04_geneDACA015172 [Acorus gramineus]
MEGSGDEGDWGLELVWWRGPAVEAEGSCCGSMVEVVGAVEEIHNGGGWCRGGDWCYGCRGWAESLRGIDRLREAKRVE